MRREFGKSSARVLLYPPITVCVGEFVAIVGPSGVGKTTWLSMLGGLECPTSGTVTVEPETSPSQAVSWIGQLNNVVGHRSIADNVMIGSLASGRSRREALRDAEAACEALGIEPLMLTPARRVSGGELQRATVARSLASRRPFIFADEPTGNLDSSSTEDVVAALRASVDRGKGVVVVTHDSAVAGSADRIVSL